MLELTNYKSEQLMKNIFKQFKDITKNPENFLCGQKARTEKAKQLLKELYDLTVKNENIEYNEIVLSELILDGVDEEQIWQQIEIRNSAIWPKFLEDTSKFLAIKNNNFIINCACFLREDSLTLEYRNKIDNEDNGADSSEMENDEETDNISVSKQRKRKKLKSYVVDDKFFKLAELEEFLSQEDRREELKQNGKLYDNDLTIDYFENLSDEDEENVKYQEFFDDEEDELSPESLEKNRRRTLKKRRKSEESHQSEVVDEDFELNEEQKRYQKLRKNSDNGLLASNVLDKEGNEYNDSNLDDLEQRRNNGDKNENDYDEGNKNFNENKSSFERRQERLKEKIVEYEENRLQDKPWQLKGEMNALGRPQNSLLEEILEFDAATRPAPVITEETTLRLEDIISQRIKHKAWDDVERIYKPVQTLQEFRKKLVLDQEKSRESLAQIYEKEYYSQIEKLNPNNLDAGAEEEPKKRKEISELMKSLFTKLDALSNFHYTPKPVAPEPKIITNTPAVTMEEIAPVAMSEANLLAPEEVKYHPKGNVIGKSEKQKSDKNRERRKKKLYQKKLYKIQEEKEAEKQKLRLKLSKKDEKDKNLRNVIKHRNVQKIESSSESAPGKSSKSFFSILQDKTFMAAGLKRNAERANKEGITAKKVKL